MKWIFRQTFEDSSLRVLHLHNNQLDFNDTDDLSNAPVHRTFNSPFQHLSHLQELNLRNNSITSFLKDWSFLNTQLKALDLSHNRIAMIDFGNTVWSDRITINVSHNQITTMSAGSFAPIPNQPLTTWILNYNPLNCDCMLIHLANYLISGKSSHLKLVTEQLVCAAPVALVNKRLEEIPLNQLICPLDHANAKRKQCPSPCTCYVRTYDSTAVFNCSNAKLNKIPMLPDIKNLGLQHYELHIENNNITELPTANQTGFKSVNRIMASNNSLHYILPEQLPNNLFVLDLSANRLQRINANALHKLSHMQNLQTVSFGKNPWICECATKELVNFIETHPAKVDSIDNTTCDGEQLTKAMMAHGVCPVDTTIILIVVGATIVVIFLLSIALYYKNQQEIMVWMFAQRAFSCLFTNNFKSDDQKVYDAFILHAMADADFVFEQLVPPMECGPKPLKVCILERELKGGAIIPLEVSFFNFKLRFNVIQLLNTFQFANNELFHPTQIAKYVATSRRTIVVLTPNFMDSFSLSRQVQTDALSSKRHHS